MPAVEAVPGMRRLSNLDPLTSKQLRDAERDKVYIFNVAPREHRVMLNKLYIIPACPEGADVSEALVIPGMVYTSKVKKVSGLDVEYEWLGDDGADVARDVVGTAPFKDSSENLTRMGVFIAADETPTQQEKDTAKAAWLQRCSEKVAEADGLASINNGMVDVGGGRMASNIGRDHREALKELGQVRAWSGEVARMVQCEECGTPNVPGAARCKNGECRCIFDEAKCRQRFPEMFAHERAKPGPKPKLDEVAA